MVKQIKNWKECNSFLEKALHRLWWAFWPIVEINNLNRKKMDLLKKAALRLTNDMRFAA